MSTYINTTFESSADDLAQAAYDELTANLPGWDPSRAQGTVEVWLIRALARIAEEVAAVAAPVPSTIFKQFGADFFGLVPAFATPARTTATVVARDTLGYTLPAGSTFSVQATGDELVLFTVDADVVIAPGSSTTAVGGVALSALDAGASANNIGGVLVPVDALDWISSASLVAAVVGGVDDEDDDAFLDRLRGLLQTMAPRPIIPADVETIVQQVPGVGRALAQDLTVPGTNEVQTFGITGASGGSATITWNAIVSAGIPWLSTAAAAQAAMEAMSNIGLGNVKFTGGPMGTAPYVITFTGRLARTDVAQLTVQTAGLTGSPVISPAISTTLAGSADVLAQERSVTVVVADSATLPVSAATKDAVDALLEAKRETNFIFNVVDPTYIAIKVTCTVTALKGYDGPTVQAAVLSQLTAYLSPGNWSAGFQNQPNWRDNKTLRFYELISQLDQAPGVDFVNSLTFAAEGTTLAAADITFAGTGPLPTAGTIIATVVVP